MSTSHNIQDQKSTFFPKGHNKAARISANNAFVAEKEAISGKKHGSLPSGDISPVELSGDYQEFLKIKDLAMKAPDLAKEDKIAQLKDSVKNGTYRVDEDELAKRIVVEELGMPLRT